MVVYLLPQGPSVARHVHMEHRTTMQRAAADWITHVSNNYLFMINRWWQLASGLSSRDILRVLLKELGPAAESDHLEHFDGLVSFLVISINKALI